MAMTRSQRFCYHPGCSKLVNTTYCPEHAPLHEKRTDLRVNAGERGYDARWQALRKTFLRRHPLCERHMSKHGEAVIATVAHHITPISEGGARLDARNLQALCWTCHEVIHGRKAERNHGRIEPRGG